MELNQLHFFTAPLAYRYQALTLLLFTQDRTDASAIRLFCDGRILNAGLRHPGPG